MLIPGAIEHAHPDDEVLCCYVTITIDMETVCSCQHIVGSNECAPTHPLVAMVLNQSLQNSANKLMITIMVRGCHLHGRQYKHQSDIDYICDKTYHKIQE